jgi:hypothetical protein
MIDYIQAVISLIELKLIEDYKHVIIVQRKQLDV